MTSIYTVPAQVPVWWESSIGRWVVSLPPNYPKSDLTRLRNYLLKVQLERRIGLVAGDVRDDLDRSIEALKKSLFIHKAQLDSQQRAILYERPSRENPQRTILFPQGEQHG